MLCPIYVFPSNHIIYIYIITIIVYFIETYIYIIKTSHVLLTYKSKCLTEVEKENPGCFWLTRKENPGDCEDFKDQFNNNALIFILSNNSLIS
jgi:hypothetical protein